MKIIDYVKSMEVSSKRNLLSSGTKTNQNVGSEWNKICTKCNNSIKVGSNLAYCTSCMEELKEFGWFDETW